MTGMNCSMAELQAVLLARDLADGEKAIVGTNSDVQVAACNLARCRQAPTICRLEGSVSRKARSGKTFNSRRASNLARTKPWM